MGKRIKDKCVRVSDEFHRHLKSAAAKAGLSMVNYTEVLVKKKKAEGFNFEIVKKKKAEGFNFEI